MRRLCALIVTTIVAACGATAPLPEKTVWPFGEADAVTATRKPALEPLSDVSLADRISIVRSPGGVAATLFQDQSVFGPFDVRFLALADDPAVGRWAAYLKVPEDFAGHPGDPRAFVGVLSRMGEPAGHYQLQLIACNREPLASDCDFETVSQSVDFAETVSASFDEPVAVYEVTPSPLP